MAAVPSDPTFLAAARAASEARSFNQNLQCHCRNFAGNPSHPTRILYPSHSFPLHPPFATPAVSHPVCRRRTISGQIWPPVRARVGSGAEPGLWAQQESCIRAAVIQHSQIKVRATVCGGLFGLQGLCEVRVWEVAAVVCAAVSYYGFCAAGEQCEWMCG